MKVGWYCRTWGDRALLPQGEEWQAYLEAETGALRGQAEEAAALAQAAQDQVSPPTPPPPLLSPLCAVLSAQLPCCTDGHSTANGICGPDAFCPEGKDQQMDIGVMRSHDSNSSPLR